MNKTELEEVLTSGRKILNAIAYMPASNSIVALPREGLAGKVVYFERMQLLGGLSDESFFAGKPYAAELISIIRAYHEVGVSIKAKLESFVRRLEQEESIENKIRAKTYSMGLVTKLGLSVFFPLFSSISLSILNQPVIRYSPAFLAYVSLMLYLDSIFEKPKEKTGKTVKRILPFVFAAVAVFFASYTFSKFML